MDKKWFIYKVHKLGRLSCGLGCILKKNTVLRVVLILGVGLLKLNFRIISAHNETKHDLQICACSGDVVQHLYKPELANKFHQPDKVGQ